MSEDNRASEINAAVKDATMKRILLAAAASLLATAAFAEYPEKSVTIVVPFAAGGPTEIGRAHV